jgi:hypothetical protein
MNSLDAIEQLQKIPEPKDSKREAILKRREDLHGRVLVSDIFDPLDEEWTCDADNL